MQWFFGFLLRDTSRTRFAPAAVGFDVMVEIFFSVIVGKFFTWFNRTNGMNIDTVSDGSGFTIWVAGMIDIPRDIFSCGSHDRFSIPNFK